MTGDVENPPPKVFGSSASSDTVCQERRSLCSDIKSSMHGRFALTFVPFDAQCVKQGTHRRQPRREAHEYLPAAVRSVISFHPPACWCMALGFMKRPEKHDPQYEQQRHCAEKCSPPSRAPTRNAR